MYLHISCVTEETTRTVLKTKRSPTCIVPKMWEKKTRSFISATVERAILQSFDWILWRRFEDYLKSMVTTKFWFVFRVRYEFSQQSCHVCSYRQFFVQFKYILSNKTRRDKVIQHKSKIETLIGTNSWYTIFTKMNKVKSILCWIGPDSAYTPGLSSA